MWNMAIISWLLVGILTSTSVCCVVSLTTQKPLSQNVCSDSSAEKCLCEDFAFGGIKSRAESAQ